MLSPSVDIDQTIFDAVLAGRLAPGTRLGEQDLADLFGVSRTRVREAMMRLEARGIVAVRARRGWFVVEPSVEDAREAFEARRAMEVGLLRCVGAIPAGAVSALRDHLRREWEAIDAGDVGARALLLGDFHVCLADALGNRLVAEILRDLTARTNLISILHQSALDASQSCREHEDIVAAMEAGDMETAGRLMDEHIRHVEAGLSRRAEPDPLSGLRTALAPVAAGRRPDADEPRRRRRQGLPDDRKTEDRPNQTEERNP